MASDRPLLESLLQKTVSETTARIKSLESTVRGGRADEKTYFALGQSYFSRVITLQQNGVDSDPFSASLDLAQASIHTEKSITVGYSGPEAFVQAVAICVAQVMVYYRTRGYMPPTILIFKKLTDYFDSAAEAAIRKLKESSGRNQPLAQSLVESIASAVGPLISSKLYQNLPQPYGESFAASCRRLGASLGMMGINGKSIDLLLSV